MGSRIRINNPKLKKNICFIKLCPIKILKTLFPLEVNNSSPVDKVFNFIKLMNLWTDSKPKWALESESKPEIEEKHLSHKVMSN